MDAVRRGFILVGVGVFALMILLSVHPVSAAEFGNIGGKPARPRADNPRSQSIFVHEIEPQQTVSDAIELVNYTQETKTLLVYATDSIISSGGAFGCAQQVDEKKSVGSWIQLSQSEVTLASGQTQEVPFTITAPERPQVGENNGCIVVQEKGAEKQEIGEGSGRVALSFRTAIRVAVWIPGDIKKSLNIVGYAASRGEDRNYILKPRVHNNGNVSIDTEISTATSNLLGFEKDVTNQTHPILRGATSDWNIPFKPSFWGGWYKSHFTATYDENIQNFLGESDDKKMVTLTSQTIYFFAIPHPVAIFLELGILAIFGALMYRLFLFWRRRRKVAEEWELIIIDTQTDIATLAGKYGVSWKLMAKVNKLKAPYILRPGDVIRVPATMADSVKADQGNAGMEIVTIDQPTDVTALAKKYGVGWKSIAKANNLKAPYILRQGDIVKIPTKNNSKVAKLKNLRKKKAPSRLEPVVIDQHTDIVSFAESHGLDWKEIAKINKVKPPYILKPGYVVMVPVEDTPRLQTSPTPQPIHPTPPVTPTPAPAPQPVAEPAPHATTAPVAPIAAPTPPVEPPAPVPSIAPQPTAFSPTPAPQPPITAPAPEKILEPEQNQPAPAEPEMTIQDAIDSMEYEATPVVKSEPGKVVEPTQPQPAPAPAPQKPDFVSAPVPHQSTQHHKPQPSKPKVFRIQDVKKVQRPPNSQNPHHTQSDHQNKHRGPTE